MVPAPYKKAYESISFTEILKYLVKLIRNIKINEELMCETFPSILMNQFKTRYFSKPANAIWRQLTLSVSTALNHAHEQPNEDWSGGQVTGTPLCRFRLSLVCVVSSPTGHLMYYYYMTKDKFKTYWVTASYLTKSFIEI